MPRQHAETGLNPDTGKMATVRRPFTAAEETAADAHEAALVLAKTAEDMAYLRSERNSLLSSSDWTQGNDSQLSDEDKTSWATYRQSLRDLPSNTGDPANPTWPEVPE